MEMNRKVVEGGTYMAIRQAVGLVIKIGGALLLTRTIGPTEYGIAAAVAFLLTYVDTIGQFGVDVYLVRREGSEDLRTFHIGFTFLLVVGVVLAGVSLLLTPFLGQLMDIPRAGPVAAAFAIGLPISLIRIVPRALLERRLEFKYVAMIEFIGQILYYGTALPLAFAGWGVWAPVSGWWAMQLSYTTAVFISAGYVPRLRWQWDLAKQMLRYGTAYTASVWAVYLQLLVQPLIVAPAAGPEVVGFIALAEKLATALSFLRQAMARMAISVLARMQENTQRLLRALSMGMTVEVLAVGIPMAGFAVAGPIMVPLMLGDQWMPMLIVFPMIAVKNMVSASFDLHSATMRVLNRNWGMTTYYLFLGGSQLVFAGLLVPRFGMIGYGLSLIAWQPTHYIVHRMFVQSIGRPDYAPAWTWMASLLLPLFAWQLGWWALLGPLLPLAIPSVRNQLRELWSLIQRARERRGQQSTAEVGSDGSAADAAD